MRIHTTRAQHVTRAVAVDLDPAAAIGGATPARNPGGVLYDDGVHKYATAEYWIGEIGDVWAVVGRGERTSSMETPSVVSWRFKGRDSLGLSTTPTRSEMVMRSPVLRAWTSSSRSTAPAARSCG